METFTLLVHPWQTRPERPVTRTPTTATLSSLFHSFKASFKLVKCLDGPSFRVLVIDLMESTSSVLEKSDATHMESLSFLFFT